VVGDDQPDAREGQAGRPGVSEGFVKLEYDYMDFGTKNLTFTENFVRGDGTAFTFTNTMDIREWVQVIRASLNYRFNWAAPVVTK
jgi:hypothetical protein